MATLTGNKITATKAQGWIQATYTTSTSATQLTISGTLYVYLHDYRTSGTGAAYARNSSSNVSATNGTVTKTFNNTEAAQGSSGTSHATIGTFTITVPKKTSSQSITFKITSAVDVKGATGLVVSGASSATVTISLASLQSYAVTYYYNNGTTTTGTQTKYYGQNLTLNPPTPALSGYTLKGWATSKANASAGTVSSYTKGTNYTANAALDLYGVFELTYSKPAVSDVTVERCKSDGTLDDEGQYAKVGFTWSIFASLNARYYGGNTYPYSSNTVASCIVTVGSETATPTLSGTSGTESVVVGTGIFNVDTEYSTSIVVTDSQTISGSNTTIVTGLLPTSSFPIDINATGEAIGFLRPAPDNGQGVFVNGNVFADTFYSEKTDGKAFHQVSDGSGGSTDTGLWAERTDQSTSMFCGVGGGGVNHGIYSNKNSRWMIYDDASGITKIPAADSQMHGHTIGTMETFTISDHNTTSATVNATTATTAATQTFTKAGYYPLAISGWTLNGSQAVHLTLLQLYISSQANGSVGVTYRIRNNSSTNSTSTYVKVYILWIKA